LNLFDNGLGNRAIIPMKMIREIPFVPDTRVGDLLTSHMMKIVPQ